MGIGRLSSEIEDKQIAYKATDKPKETEKAKEEAGAFSEGRDLGKESEANEHERKEKLRDIYANLVMGLIFVMFVLAIISVITLFLHLVLPEKSHWMTPKQIEKLFIVCTSGLIASLLAGAFQRYLFKS